MSEIPVENIIVFAPSKGNSTHSNFPQTNDNLDRL
jgi:hypothetical protein